MLLWKRTKTLKLDTLGSKPGCTAFSHVATGTSLKFSWPRFPHPFKGASAAQAELLLHGWGGGAGS